MVGSETNRNGALVQLLRELVALPDMLFVMGKGPEAVMEGWVDQNGTEVKVQKDWVSVESKPWHCHIHLTELASVRFVEEADPHDRKRQAFSIRFLGQEGNPLLMVFFGKVYKEGGILIAERVARFHALRERFKL